MRERAEHAAGMSDKGDRARRGLARARKAADPDMVEVVVEAHAVRPAQRNAGRLRDAGEPRAPAGDRRRPEEAGSEDDRGLGAGGDRSGKRLLQPLVPDRENREIRRRWKIGKPGDAGIAFDLAVVRVDRMNDAGKAAAADHPHHVVARRVGPRRSPRRKRCCAGRGAAPGAPR